MHPRASAPVPPGAYPRSRGYAVWQRWSSSLTTWFTRTGASGRGHSKTTASRSSRCSRGFFLSAPFLRARLEDRPSPKALAFLRARAARIYPGYWVALAGARPHRTAAHGPRRCLAGHHPHTDLGTDTPFEGLLPAWSLSLFLSFYVAIPAWSWWRRRADGKARPIESILRRDVAWLLLVVLLAWVVRTTEVTDPIANTPITSCPGARTRLPWDAARRSHPQRAPAALRRDAFAARPPSRTGVTGGPWFDHRERRPSPSTSRSSGTSSTPFAAAALIAGAVLVGPVLRGVRSAGSRRAPRKPSAGGRPGSSCGDTSSKRDSTS